MISPEDGAELARVNGDGTPNLKDTTRALMAQMEEDLGTRLDWVAVDHFDTAHPHTHIIARGVTHDGKGLNIAGEYAELRQDGQKNSIIYKRGYLKALEAEGFNSATEKLETMTGKAHIAAQSGRLIEGTVAQKFELPQGPHAIIETQRAFYLVPWESHHAQRWGKRIKGRVLSGGGIDWETGRTRGIGR